MVGGRGRERGEEWNVGGEGGSLLMHVHFSLLHPSIGDSGRWKGIWEIGYYKENPTKNELPFIIQRNKNFRPNPASPWKSLIISSGFRLRGFIQY